MVPAAVILACASWFITIKPSLPDLNHSVSYEAIDVFEVYKVNNQLYYISIDLVLDSDGIQALNTALCPYSRQVSYRF